MNADRWLALSKVFLYPSEDYARDVAAARDGLQDEELGVLEGAVRRLSVEEAQELYTSTFDLNPACTLDLGWHLFGEDYARGVFLARLRSEHRRLGVDEEGELPDHLSTVLHLVPRMGKEEAGRFCRDFLLPALDKMSKKLKESASPYAGALEAGSRLAQELAETPGMGNPHGSSLGQTGEALHG